MQCSRINFKKRKSSKKISFLNVTKAALVSWFVAWVNWANDDDCKLMLFDVVIRRLFVNVIR